jgi:uncharacterized membrane protein YeaQ/YmgE (transglycosylase-associated protein family)
MLIFALIGIAVIAGFIAQLILGRNRRRTNWGEAFMAGFIGSFVGGLLVSLIAGDGLRLRPTGLIGSIAGAVIVLLIWGGVRGRSTA